MIDSVSRFPGEKVTQSFFGCRSRKGTTPGLDEVDDFQSFEDRQPLPSSLDVFAHQIRSLPPMPGDVGPGIDPGAPMISKVLFVGGDFLLQSQ